MSMLADSFLLGAQRVTLQTHYFKPRQVGQGPLKIQPSLLGQKTEEINHTGILHTFVLQEDDTSDLQDERLRDIFDRLVLSNGGIIKIHDRRKRFAIMTEEAHLLEQTPLLPEGMPQPKSLVVPQILIPTPEEEGAPGMAETMKAFKTFVPFPRVRHFLQFWQEQIEGPLHHVQFAAAKLGDHGGVQAGYHIQ